MPRNLAAMVGPEGLHQSGLRDRCPRRRRAAHPYARARRRHLSDEGRNPRDSFAPERLVFTNIALDEAGNHIIEGFTTVTFADEGGKTKLTLHTRGSAVVEKAVAYLQGMEMGWTQSIDKLAALLARGK